MRTHIVMVPGFGGFDALGQLNYYSGVTQQFEAWLSGATRAQQRGVLHYFENLPTAAVVTRGAMLARYVKKLVERDVIQHDDDIVLVGHSTGGLDIRQMIRDLAAAAEGAGDPVARANPRDDAARDAQRARQLLDRINRIVFLSVPQRGTNIADWVRAHRGTTRALVALLRRAVGLPVSIPIGPVERLLRLMAHGRADLLDAVDDAGRDLYPANDDALALADARQARADIDLWLAHQDHDFFAIDDLAAKPSVGRIVDTPEVDARLWKANGIGTRSYATIGKAPYPAAELRANAGRSRGLPSILRALRASVADTDFVYRVAYSACAGGPFDPPPTSFPLLGDPATTRPIERWENDGIVNTAAMASPDGVLPFLVAGDHADIIGHFALREHSHASKDGRRYDSYDLLGSDNTFTTDQFSQVWKHLFEFAVP